MRLKVTAAAINEQAFLSLAERGIPVFPVRPEAETLPDGKVLGPKSPLIVGWQRKATTSRAVIRRWLKLWPDALPAIPTGPASGFAVLDLDQKDGKDGVAVLRALGLDPDRLSGIIVRTASGGRHLYFRCPKGLKNSVGKGESAGVDIRAADGLVVAPGAILPDGRSYDFIVGGMDDLALLAEFGIGADWPGALPRKGYIEAGPILPAVDQSDVPEAVEVARGALARVKAKVAEAAERRESRTGALYAQAFHLGTFLACNTLTEEEARAALWEAAEEVGHPETYGADETERHIASGLAKGAQFPSPWVDPAGRIAGFGPSDAELAEIEAILGEPQPDFGPPMMKNRIPVSNQRNANYYLHRDRDTILPGLRLNQMTHLPEWQGGAITDSDLAHVRSELEKTLGTVAMDYVAAAVRRVSAVRPFHPIRDWLTGLRTDGRSLLDTWLTVYLGAEDTPATRAAGRMFLIQMVARIMDPGCKADHMLVLSGDQGQGKSAACRALAGNAYFTDTLPRIDGSKEPMEHLQGMWVVELAELASMRDAGQEDLKRFLTTQVDRFRAAYGRTTEAHPRQCVFIGTTNKKTFLRDETGGRRFWPVACEGECDPEGLARDRDQLFAEAMAAYRAGEAWWPDRGFEREHLRPVQEAFYGSDPWEDTIRDWLDTPPADKMDGSAKPRRDITVNEVMADCLGIPAERQNRKVEMRVASILKDRLGWAKVKTHRQRAWRRPKGAHLTVVK